MVLEELIWIRDLDDLNGLQYCLEVRNYQTGDTKLVYLGNYYQEKKLFFEDMDGDGTTEVLMARGIYNNAYWDQMDLFMSETSDGSALIEAYGNFPPWDFSQCTFVDFNGDRKPELLVQTSDSAYIYKREMGLFIEMSRLVVFAD